MVLIGWTGTAPRVYSRERKATVDEAVRAAGYKVAPDGTVVDGDSSVPGCFEHEERCWHFVNDPTPADHPFLPIDDPSEFEDLDEDTQVRGVVGALLARRAVQMADAWNTSVHTKVMSSESVAELLGTPPDETAAACRRAVEDPDVPVDDRHEFGRVGRWLGNALGREDTLATYVVPDDGLDDAAETVRELAERDRAPESTSRGDEAASDGSAEEPPWRSGVSVESSGKGDPGQENGHWW